MRPHLMLTCVLATPLLINDNDRAAAQACQTGRERVDVSVKATPARIAQLAWLGATWIGTAGRATTVEERWTPPASGTMLAVGRTLRGAELAGFEFVCIAERDGSLAYIAMPNGRTPATIFTLTSITTDSATFENPAHDYPKLIRYTRLADGSLQTAVSGGAGTREDTVVLRKQ